jgi:hypothetical protein
LALSASKDWSQHGCVWMRWTIAWVAKIYAMHQIYSSVLYVNLVFDTSFYQVNDWCQHDALIPHKRLKPHEPNMKKNSKKSKTSKWQSKVNYHI